MTETNACVIGVDMGTGSLRSALYDLDGKQIAEARHPARNLFLDGGRVEQDIGDLRRGLKLTIAECFEKSGVDKGAVKGIGLDGTSGTVAPVDARGEPLALSLLWMDTRSSGEMDDINATADPVLDWCGGQTSSEWVLPKILWFKRARPDVYAKTWKFMEPPDFILYHLTGRVASSFSNAVHKRHYVAREGGWPTRLLAKIGLDDLMDKWPVDVKRCWEAAGRVTWSAAAEYGLPAGIPVVNAGNDGPAAMIGLGVLEPGDVAMTVGTSTCFLLFHDRKKAIPGFWGPFPGGVFEDAFVYDVGQVSSGAIIDWYRQLLFAGFGRSFSSERFDELERAAAALPPNAMGVSALDFWQGNRTPHNDPRIRGAVWGLSLQHGPEHIYRAILEATAFGARRIFDILEENDVPVKKIVAGGGG